MVKLKSTGSSGTAAVVSNQYVKIQSIDSDNYVAHVINQVKATRQVSLTHMVGKGVGFPQAGETWLITSQFGPWMFVAQVNPDYPTYIEDTDSRLSDARTPTGTAGGVLGGTYPNPTIPAPSVSYIGAASQPAFQNSWVNYGGAFENIHFYKDVDGVVHLGGLAKSGTLGQIMFVLPAGYRPTGQKVFSNSVSSSTVGRTDVYQNGSVYAVGSPTGTNGYWSLEGIHFLATN